MSLLSRMRSFFVSDRQRLARLRTEALAVVDVPDFDAVEVAFVVPAWALDRVRIVAAVFSCIAALCVLDLALDRGLGVPRPATLALLAVLSVIATVWASRRFRPYVVARRGNRVFVVSVPESGTSSLLHTQTDPLHATFMRGWRTFPHFKLGELRLAPATMTVSYQRALAVGRVLGVPVDRPDSWDRLADG